MSGSLATKNSIRFLLQKQLDDSQVFKAIITHPMETGARRDSKTGQFIPADYIDSLRVLVDGSECFASQLGQNISKHPFVSFVFTRPLQSNQIFRIEWIDNHEEMVFYETDLVFDGNGKFSFQSKDKATVVPQLVPDAGPAGKTRHIKSQQ